MEDKNYLIQFVEWTKLKIRIHIKSDDKIVYFREREVWWASIGANIGFEQDGKNKNFERPILVIKKFSRHLLWVIPLTSKQKIGDYYYQFDHEGKKFSAILVQLKLISSKRLLRRIRQFDKDNFDEIIKRLKSFL